MPKVFVPMTITIRLPVVLEHMLSQRFRQGGAQHLFPQTTDRIQQLGQLGASLWKERATKLPGGEGRPLSMSGGVNGRMVRLNRSDYMTSIVAEPVQVDHQGVHILVHSTNPQAAVIEDGTPGGAPMDLHEVLAYGRKVRQGKKGRYLRIPFRHSTTVLGGGAGSRLGAGVLPSGIIAVMSEKPRYLRRQYLGREQSLNQPRRFNRKFLYTPAKPAQLTAAEIEGVSRRARRHKISPDYAKNLVGLMHVGRRGHGSYLTIRTLSEANPEGWRISPYQAQGPAAATKRDIQHIAKGWFRDAIKADLTALYQ